MSNNHGNIDQAGQELITLQLTPEQLGAALAAVGAGLLRMEGASAPDALEMRGWLAGAADAMASAGVEHFLQQQGRPLQ